MLKTLKKLGGYYKPYKGLFFSDMFFAILGAAITLVIPLIVRYITSNIVNLPVERATGMIVKLGIFMVLLVLVEAFCNFYIAYYGHIMGARIERDMRNEIFGHCLLLFTIIRRWDICFPGSRQTCLISVSFCTTDRKIW